MTISGTGFRQGVTVTIGGVKASVTGTSGSQIIATAPAHPPGLVDVTVTNPGGETFALAGSFTYVPLTVTSIETPVGFAEIRLDLRGSGFLPSTVVRFDGVGARTVPLNTSTMMVFIPPHAIGPVDIVATNPGGESATLSGAFAYGIPPVLTVAQTSVAPGAQVAVSWVATTTWGLDWIGIFKASTPNESWIQYVWTGGARSGTANFTAPAEPGQYEFRYLPNDTYIDIARSAPVTVTGSAAGAR